MNEYLFNSYKIFDPVRLLIFNHYFQPYLLMV